MNNKKFCFYRFENELHIKKIVSIIQIDIIYLIKHN